MPSFRVYDGDGGLEHPPDGTARPAERELVRLFAGSPVGDVYFDPGTATVLHRVELRPDPESHFGEYFAVYVAVRETAPVEVFEGLADELDRLVTGASWDRLTDTDQEYPNAAVRRIEEFVTLSEGTLDSNAEEALERYLMAADGGGTVRLGLPSREEAMRALYRFRDCGCPVVVGEAVQEEPFAVDVIGFEYGDHERYEPLNEAAENALRDGGTETAPTGVDRAVAAVEAAYEEHVESDLGSPERKLHAVDAVLSAVDASDGSLDEEAGTNEAGRALVETIEDQAETLDSAERSAFYDAVDDFLAGKRSRLEDEHKRARVEAIDEHLLEAVEEVQAATGESATEVREELLAKLTDGRYTPRVGKADTRLVRRRGLRVLGRFGLLVVAAVTFGILVGYRFTGAVTVLDGFVSALLLHSVGLRGSLFASPVTLAVTGLAVAVLMGSLRR